MTINHRGVYKDLNVFFGDIHNHCNASYGYGSLEEAIVNAKLQLDFTSVTLHAVWPDMPVDDPNLSYLVDYHRKGFSKAYANWPSYLVQMDTFNQDGKFVTFPSYEWHSNEFGDHCVYYKNGLGNEIIDKPDLVSLREALHKAGSPAILIPHHIGYKQGYRGINWQTFTSDISPVAEIMSFHGSSESSEGAYPYLHSMGPRHEMGTAQFGWASGKIFGVIGSTDQHHAFPGSYGEGRLGVWASALTRDDIWEAIIKRRTYALTGDRIELAFSLNGHLMGDISPSAVNRMIEVAVTAGSNIDYIEVLHNNRVIHRECPLPNYTNQSTYKVFVEVGWGEKSDDTEWNVDLRVNNGNLLGVEPRFRGFRTKAESLNYKENVFTQWERITSQQVHFNTSTSANPNFLTPATAGISLEIQGNSETNLEIKVNELAFNHKLSDLINGSRTHYLGGFVSPAICIHQAVPESDYKHKFSFTHHHEGSQRDWYHIRVRQRNDQWAWSSPIWVEK